MSARTGGAPATLEAEVRPPSPFRLGRGSTDRTLRVDRGIATRLLQVDCRPVLVRAWQPGPGRVKFRAEAVDPARLTVPPVCEELHPAGREELTTAIERMRFALGVDEDMSAFHARFRRDPLVGPIIRRMPGFRPPRRIWPWGALAAAGVGQLIEASRAAVIERPIVGRWGARLGEGRGAPAGPGPAFEGRPPPRRPAVDGPPGRPLGGAPQARPRGRPRPLLHR